MTDSPFSKHIPKLQVAWDQTSLQEALFCPRRYQYRIIEGWTSKIEAVDLTFGIMYHAALEVYDKALAGGKSWEEAQDLALQKVLSDSHGWDSDMPEKNRFTLIRSVVWYTEHWQNDAFPTIILPSGVPAVELSFRIELPLVAPGGDKYLLCGHLDGLVKNPGTQQDMVRERKTTKRQLNQKYFDGFSPDTQVNVYTMAGNIALRAPTEGVLIDACQTGVNFSRFSRGISLRTPAQVTEFLSDLTIHLRQFEEYASEEYWPMNWRNCWSCHFRGICSKDPEARKSWLEADYQKRPWNPLESR
jgi:hypothetical protein